MSESPDNPAAPHPDPSGLDLFMTVIRVTGWSAIVPWYVDILGLKLLLVDKANEFALLAAGTGRVGLQGTKEPRPASARGLVRLVFQVADLDHHRRLLLDRGVAIGEPIENSAEGYREVRLQDPEGNSLRLFSWRDPDHAHKFALRPA